MLGRLSDRSIPHQATAFSVTAGRAVVIVCAALIVTVSAALSRSCDDRRRRCRSSQRADIPSAGAADGAGAGDGDGPLHDGVGGD